MQTRKLFDEKPYETSFEAVILQVQPCENGGNGVTRILELDQTLFFPEEGGQTPDQGTLAGGLVLDVQIRDGMILHTVHWEQAEAAGAAGVTEGMRVTGEIDWPHRFSNMQQHSGEHIFSGLVHQIFGYENVGFHLSDHEVTMDYNGPLTPEQTEELEILANRVITQNLVIDCRYPAAEELESIDYRSKKEIQGAVRIVTIPGVDVCACCAPHVHRTGEIGFLKVISRQNYKGGTRLSILCGERALAQVISEHSLLTGMAQNLSTSADQIPAQIQKQQEMIASLSSELQSARKELLLGKLAQIPADRHCVCLIEEGMDAGSMRQAVNTLMEGHDGYCGAFSGNGEGYNFILGIREGDARKALEDLKQILNGAQVRGGGSAQMVQGKILLPETLTPEAAAQKIEVYFEQEK